MIPTLVLLLLAATAPPPAIDGVVGDAEWAGARHERLKGGGKILLLPRDGVLYVAVTGKTPGIATVCAGNASEVSILHASAALGTAKYERHVEGWFLTQNFEFSPRDPTDEQKAKFFEDSGWIANASRSGVPAREFAIRMKPRWERISVAFLGTEPSTIASWPESIGDDCSALRLNQGWLDQKQRFVPAAWSPMPR